VIIKIKLGLVDSDRLYLERLTEQFGKKYGGQIEVWSFSEVSSVIRSVRDNRINILVVSQDIEIDEKSLSSSCAVAYLTDTPDIETYNGCGTVFRYQRTDALYRAVIGLYSEKISDRIVYRKNTGRAGITLFLPEAEGSGAASAAAAFSEISSENNKKTLFLNLRQFRSTESLFTSSGNSTLTDVVFSLKSRKANMRLKLDSIVKQCRGVYYFDSCANPLDITEMTGEELMILLDELGCSCGYERIVIVSDFYISDRLNVLMESADRIVIVSGSSPAAEARLKRKYDAVLSTEKRMQNSIIQKTGVIYNRSDKALKTEIPVLGIFPDQGPVDDDELIKRMKKSDVFCRIPEREDEF